MHYFDNAATTMPSQATMRVFQEVSTNFFANPSSLHQLGVQSQKLLQQSREQIANLLHFKTEEIYFLSSGTEANNWVFDGVLQALAQIHPHRKQIIIGGMEHASVSRLIVPLEKQGYRVDRLTVTSEGFYDTNHLEKLLSDQTLLVSTMAVNNEIGSIQPLSQMGELLSQYPQVAWHVDAVQAVVGAMDTVVSNRRIDMISLSGHKFHAGRGTGILAKRQSIAANPHLYGGGQENGLRSSTENLASIVATSRSLRETLDQAPQMINQLTDYQHQMISRFDELAWTILTPTHSSPHIVCVAYPGVPGEVLVHAFEEADIYISTTSACSSRIKDEHATLNAMGVPRKVAESAIRISMSYTTNQADIDALFKQANQVTKRFHYRKESL